jgi:hypothetical protein
MTLRWKHLIVSVALYDAAECVGQSSQEPGCLVPGAILCNAQKGCAYCAGETLRKPGGGWKKLEMLEEYASMDWLHFDLAWTNLRWFYLVWPTLQTQEAKKGLGLNQFLLFDVFGWLEPIAYPCLK